MSAIADEQAAIDLDTCFAQSGNFFEERHGIKHYAVADDTAAARTQHSARHQLENELLAVDDDSVAGVVSACISRHDRKILGEHIDNLAFALVAPLRAYDDRSFSLLQTQTPRT